MNLVVEPFENSVTHVPAANTQATISSETPNALTDQVVVQSVSATLSAVATPPTAPVQVVLRDGASGAGTIKWSGKLMCAANGQAGIALSGLNIAMTPGNPATLEFVAAGGATTEETVAMTYYRSATLG